MSAPLDPNAGETVAYLMRPCQCCHQQMLLSEWRMRRGWCQICDPPFGNRAAAPILHRQLPPDPASLNAQQRLAQGLPGIAAPRVLPTADEIAARGLFWARLGWAATGLMWLSFGGALAFIVGRAAWAALS